ncbi:hypothetical protein [Krasilnikoviella flava]|nr:hypothetical protein [Krasilnikoviella flava]
MAHQLSAELMLPLGEPRGRHLSPDVLGLTWTTSPTGWTTLDAEKVTAEVVTEPMVHPTPLGYRARATELRSLRGTVRDLAHAASRVVHRSQQPRRPVSESLVGGPGRVRDCCAREGPLRDAFLRFVHPPRACASARMSPARGTLRRMTLTITTATVTRRLSDVVLAWTLSDIPPDDAMVTMTITFVDEAGARIRQLGFKLDYSRWVASFVFDHVGVRNEYIQAKPQRVGDRWTIVFPLEALDGIESGRWRADLSVDSYDAPSVHGTL